MREARQWLKSLRQVVATPTAIDLSTRNTLHRMAAILRRRIVRGIAARLALAVRRAALQET